MGTIIAPTRIAIHNILAATDFSPAGEAAVQYAAVFAHRYGSTLHTVHVLPRTPLVESADVDPEKMKRVAEKKMSDTVRSEVFQGIAHKELIGEGDVGDVLSRLVREQQVDLIVLGTEGRTGLGKFLLGSVAEEVFRTAECPVLTLGPKVTRGIIGLGGRLQHILYATDFGPESEHGLPYALSLAEEHQARLTMVHVAHQQALALPDAAMPPVLTPYESVEAGEKKLREMVATGPKPGRQPEFLVQFGEPVETILRIAAKEVDLIVLGVKRPAALTKHLGSGVAYQIVCQAACPVLTAGAQTHR